MKKIITTALSLFLTCALYFGGDPVHDFAFYVLSVCNALAWLSVLLGCVKDDLAEEIRRGIWLSTLLSGVQIAAMVATGHPLLAASSFVCSAIIVAESFKRTDRPGVKKGAAA